MGIAFVTSLLIGAVSYTVIGRFRKCTKKLKIISECEFAEIMRILSKRIFLQLFSLAQVSARIVPKSDDNKFKSIRFDNPAIRDLLAFCQQSVLEQFHISTNDLEHAQSLYYKKGNGELDIIVDSIALMFDQFADGSFPVLPSEVAPESSPPADSNQLLELLSTILMAKAENGPDQVDEDAIMSQHGHTSAISFYNQVAKRLQNDAEFRNGLIQILVKNQTIVRSNLE